jgi:hypothetical protein
VKVNVTELKREKFYTKTEKFERSVKNDKYDTGKTANNRISGEVVKWL